MTTTDIHDAEAEFMRAIREEHGWSQAIHREAMTELSGLAGMADEVVRATKALCEARARLWHATRYQRGDFRPGIQLIVRPEELAQRMVDALDLGTEATAYLRAKVDQAMRET